MTTADLYVLPARMDNLGVVEHEEQYPAMRTHSLQRAVFPFGGEGWIATRYDIVKSFLSDPRFSVEATATAGDYPRVRLVENGPPWPVSFMGYDGKRHAQKRAVLMQHLSVKRVQAMEPDIERIAEELLDDIEAQGKQQADLVLGYAQKLSVRVLSHLLGVPREGSLSLSGEVIESALSLSSGRARTQDEVNTVIETLSNYFARLVEWRRERPGDDLISAMIRHTDGEGAWTEDELNGSGTSLVFAGHDATAGMLGGIMEWLVHQSELYDHFRDNPEAFLSAFEEFSRFIPATSTGSRSRIALEDVQVGDVLVRKGEVIISILHAANLDEAAFPHGRELDLGRDVVNQSVAFGYGPHSCPGRRLARTEIDIAIRVLLRRFDRLSPVDQSPNWRDKRLMRGPQHLLVTW